MNSSIAASMIASRRSAVRSARLDAGSFAETNFGVLACAARIVALPVADFAGVELERDFFMAHDMTDWSVIVKLIENADLHIGVITCSRGADGVRVL
jgi:hypothetical protein